MNFFNITYLSHLKYLEQIDYFRKIRIIRNNLFYFNILSVNENKVTIIFYLYFKRARKKILQKYSITFIIRFELSTILQCHICIYMYISVGSKIKQCLLFQLKYIYICIKIYNYILDLILYQLAV